MSSKPKLYAIPGREDVERGGEADVRTEFGVFRMVGYWDNHCREHLAIVKGDVRGAGVLCRVHSECLTGEVLHSRHCDCREQLHLALERIERAGAGVVVYLRQEGRGIGLVHKLRAYALQNGGVDTLEANLRLGFGADMRTYDVAAAILEDLGVESIALLTNNPAKVRGLQEADVRVDRRVAHVVEAHDDNRGYIETKRKKMGHLLV